MPSDISRKPFNKKKHYSGVINQQGRVSLDADLNEQLDIQLYRTHTQTKDVIGYSGVPKKNNGFLIKIQQGVGLTIAPGRIYVGGLLCELEKEDKVTTYFTQPYYPEPDTTFLKVDFIGGLTSPPSSPFSPPASPVLSPPHGSVEDGIYIVYIDAWQREINYLDDPLIQEVALGEADTTARLQTVWQVKLMKVDVGNIIKPSCKTPFKEWEDLVKPLTGKLNAQTKKDIVPNDPCSLKPGTGFRGLENQLYRVEIQEGDSFNNAKFKWSRDNATLETTIEKISGSVITVTSTGKDDLMSFATGQWVEIVDKVSSLHNKPNPLVQINHVDPSTREITLSKPATQYSGKEGLKLRRWDQLTGSENGIPVAAGWMDIEDGIQVMFTNGTYKPGDYWIIPARTATAEIEWPPFTEGILPIPQLPIGTKHHYSKLALLKSTDGIIALEDCRELFPSLTEICAEDVCFKNDNCQLSEAQNVQEALDLLCAAQDLRDHNKHLHGYGVVCGLKVKCGIDRKLVTIENGYALDCEGNIIRLNKKPGLNYDVVPQAANAGLLDENGNGEVALSISYKGKSEPVISVEKYQQKSFWDEILEGSLLKDFFDEDIKPLVDFIKKQITFPLTDTPPVPIGQQRLTALINLLFQKINSASGPYIFLSGNQQRSEICAQKPEEKQNEDQLLYCLYKELKELLASETFCAMFDNDRPFPAYKIEPGLDTIFGPTLKFHNRLRVHPGGNFAYTCGLDNKIYVYDLAKLQLHQTLVFPSTSNIKLQDIAVSTNGKELYATGLLDDKDSIIAIVSVNAASGKHDWVNGSSVKCAFKYVSLAVGAGATLFAISKGKGLFKLSGIGTNSFTETPVVAFNATGLLIIPDAQNIAYAASAGPVGGAETNNFIKIDSINLATNTLQTSYPSAGSNGAEDILVHKDLLYVTGFNGAQRIVRRFVIGNPAQTFVTNVESSSSLRLSVLPFNADIEYLLVTLSDKFKVIRIKLQNHLLDAKFRIPVQLFPIAIVTSPKRKFSYVLNTGVNTLTTIDAEKVFKTPQPNYTEEPPFEIADYHDDVIAAYTDVMSHLLQYLKDAFCGKFIIDCPTCNEKDKVYLGTVKIRGTKEGSKVYRICNFSKRRYVKTFRTWGYWLSVIPILPAIKTAFVKFCCSVLDKKSP
jgi:DNA-binding beta-propeller fold protein YncE